MRIISLMMSAAIGALLLGCESKEEGLKMATPAVPVKAVTPVIKDVTVHFESIGVLQPSVFMEVRPQVDGTLAAVFTSEGEWVEAGWPLFKIDPKPSIMKVKEAEAQLSIDRANDQAAQKKLARYAPLAQKELVSQMEWEDREAEAKKTRAAIALDEAKLESAKLEWERCTVNAPTAGRIGKLDAHPGLLVAKGQQEPLVTITELNPLRVEFTLTEKEFPKLSQGSLQIEVKPLCGSSDSTKGEITFMDNHVDAARGLILVRGVVENPDYTLRPGQSVQVRIPIAVTKQAKLIPQKAIRYNSQGPYVYVVQADQTVSMRQLVLGEEQGIDQIVKEGIEPSEQLIVDGHLRISPGIKVEVKP